MGLDGIFGSKHWVAAAVCTKNRFQKEEEWEIESSLYKHWPKFQTVFSKLRNSVFSSFCPTSPAFISFSHHWHLCVCLPVTIVHPWNSSRRVISRLSLVLYSKDDSTVMITFISNSLPLEVSLKKKKRNKTNLCCWEWMWKSLVFVKRELESLIFLRLQSPADI